MGDAVLSPSSSSSLKRRLLSAAVLVPLIAAIVYFGSYAFAAFLAVVGVLALYEFWTMASKTNGRLLVTALGIVYIGAGLLMAYHMRVELGLWATVVFFAAIWLSDTGAYFAGKTIGGPKMAGAISPNKTWAGYAGALLTPALVFAVCYQDLIWALPAGIAIGATGQAGDLLMSWFKRQVKVKDSSSLIPGHGGMLDRIDSMIPVVPVYLALFKLAGWGG